jgi:hypothetical protein
VWVAVMMKLLVIGFLIPSRSLYLSDPLCS